MKIAFIDVTTTVTYGGIQTAVWQLAIALTDAGHEVTVFGGEGTIRPDLRGRNVRIETFPFTPREKAWDLGSRFRRMVERWTFARHARHAVIAGDFDWAVITKPFDFFWPWIIPSGSKTRFAFRSGGTDFYASDKLQAKRIDAWFANSHFNAWQIKSRYRIYPRVIYNGVDLDRFTPQAADPALRAGLGVAEHDMLMVFAGRIVGWKGLKVALHALADSRLRSQPIKFLVIGDGPQRQELETLARQLGIMEQIIFHPAQPHAKLPPYYASADVGLFPSVGDEGFSNSIAEAMASGLPVIATAFSGNPETVGNEGSCGLLVTPDDPAELAGAIRQLADSAPLRQQMGQAARNRIATLYTWDKVAQRLLAGLNVAGNRQ